MFCDKCGKDNRNGANICGFCGAPMPATERNSGFADILSFESKMSADGAPMSAYTERNDADMQKLIKKTDNIMSVGRKNIVFNLITIIICVVILICSVAFGLTSMNTMKRYADEISKYNTETSARLDNIEKELKGEDGADVPPNNPQTTVTPPENSAENSSKALIAAGEGFANVAEDTESIVDPNGGDTTGSGTEVSENNNP